MSSQLRDGIMEQVSGLPRPFPDQIASSFILVQVKKDEIVRCHCKCHSQSETIQIACDCNCDPAPCGIPVPGGCMMSHEANCQTCKMIAVENCM